ncbi:hypothetical protein SDC9_128461 [bioreactor metagenome]|uniref:Uncharacterized protein n=1 Tax=bioreactor metagenome TaxID=1076179 RepID=A0A645CX30_9ZZZZ
MEILRQKTAHGTRKGPKRLPVRPVQESAQLPRQTPGGIIGTQYGQTSPKHGAFRSSVVVLRLAAGLPGQCVSQYGGGNRACLPACPNALIIGIELGETLTLPDRTAGGEQIYGESRAWILGQKAGNLSGFPGTHRVIKAVGQGRGDRLNGLNPFAQGEDSGVFERRQQSLKIGIGKGAQGIALPLKFQNCCLRGAGDGLASLVSETMGCTQQEKGAHSTPPLSHVAGWGQTQQVQRQPGPLVQPAQNGAQAGSRTVLARAGDLQNFQGRETEEALLLAKYAYAHNGTSLFRLFFQVPQTCAGGIPALSGTAAKPDCQDQGRDRKYCPAGMATGGPQKER